MTPKKLKKLRLTITENLRVQRGGAKPVPYIDTTNALTDICARQNHAVFARRGCGKTLLLHESESKLPEKTRAVYLNCEDFKTHSFPNVLIEILDTVFAELETNLTGWFGRQKTSRAIITKIRDDLAELKKKADDQEEKVKAAEIQQAEDAMKLNLGAEKVGFGMSESTQTRASTEREYTVHDNKLRELNMWLPKLKTHIRGFFAATKKVEAVFIQVDDFYHLRRSDQPHVMDYLHRLCKDIPLYFKVATLRHASTLYADRDGQPTGAQERHDYQAINIDFTFLDFRRTEKQVRSILYEFGRLADCTSSEIDDLFKGDGFRRLVLTGGGVPRDCLSLFLEALGTSSGSDGAGRIGKDGIRALSSTNFERRIEELKTDCERREQDALLRGIYVLRAFVLERKTNVFLIEERMFQQNDDLRALVYRLLDYRIIHSVGIALTHKSLSGTFQAFAIDAGCYGHMRKLDGRFNEIDLSGKDARERARSAPILNKDFVEKVWSTAPADVHSALKAESGPAEAS